MRRESVRYLFNSPVLTTTGDYRLHGPVSLDEASAIARNGLYSAIGHQPTADLLSGLLKTNVVLNRRTIHMRPGERALVFRLLQRLPEGTILDHDQLSQHPHEFCVLERCA